MSESFLPPVTVEFTAGDSGFVKTLTKAVAGIKEFADAAKTAMGAADAAFTAIGSGAGKLGPLAEAAAAAKKEMQGFAQASRSVASATERAGAATGTAMEKITASADAMAAGVDAAATAAGEGIARIGVAAKETAAGLKATAAETAATGDAMKASAAGTGGFSEKLLGLGPAFEKVRKWGTLGLAGVAAASVDLGVQFQTQMTRLATAAGAPIAQVNAMKGAVLDLGTQTGFSGTAIAEALYHPVSAGLSLAASLQVVKYAAQEARISGANLDDTTYSLSSVMKAFNQSASDAGPTMAQLNAIVGQGDMRFQDFNESIKNWAPTAAQMGISITSMGAGLAYLTDRGNSAEVAATRMTMGISMATTPTAKATHLLVGMGLASEDVKASSEAMTKVLQKTGITQDQLALDLQKPDGLYVMLNHLKTALETAGVKGTEADSVLAKIFGGGRSDKAIMSLMQNLDGLKTKYEDITKAATAQNFQQAWETTTHNLGLQFDQIRASVDNLLIRLGQYLIPQLSAAITLARGGFGQALSGFTGAATKPVAHENLHNAFLNQEAASPPPLTGWQRFGQELRRIVGDVEQLGKRLEPVGADFARFGVDAYQAVLKLAVALGPTVKLLGEGLFVAVTAVGKALADVAGPALKGFADFLASHQGMIKFFAEVILGGLIVKMTVLGTLGAAKGIVGLATSIAQFPLSQLGQIGTAFGALKTAYTGQAAAEGEAAIGGLKGALGDLKTAASGVLDKFSLFNGAKLAGLAQAGQDLAGIEEAAAGAGQLSLFETDMAGIVQVAETGPAQLALFETGLNGIAAESDIASVATGGLAGKIGKFALAGGVIGGVLIGVSLLGEYLGHLAGVGDHTGGQVDKFTIALRGAADGSDAARQQLAGLSTALVFMSSTQGKPVQGLTDMDSALTQLVTSGHAADARSDFNTIAAALAKSGMSAKDAAAQFPQYEQALKDAGAAAQTTDGKVSAMMQTLSSQQSLTQFRSDMLAAQQALTDNGKALDGDSQQAVNNQLAFQQLTNDVLQYYQQQRNGNVSINDATKAMDDQITQIEALGTQFGLSKDEVDKFLAKLGLIKQSYDTTVNVDTSGAMAAIDRLNNAASNLNYDLAHPGGGLGAGHGAQYADGGFVPGPKGAPQYATVHGGEYVVSNNMQAGRAAIDAKILARMGAGPRPAPGALPLTSGGGTTVVYVTNHFAGSLYAESQVQAMVQKQTLQYKGRNSSNGLG